MRRHRKALTPVTEINLTSMLDVAFVLLIAFMIVAPQLKHGIDLQLPTVADGGAGLTSSDPAVYTILVPKPENGQQEFYMNDMPSQLADIEQRLRLQREGGKKVAVEIQADQGVSYDTFIQVVAAVRRAGIEAVGLPVEAGTVKPPAAKAPEKPDEKARTEKPKAEGAASGA